MDRILPDALFDVLFLRLGDGNNNVSDLHCPISWTFAVASGDLVLRKDIKFFLVTTRDGIGDSGNELAAGVRNPRSGCYKVF